MLKDETTSFQYIVKHASYRNEVWEHNAKVHTNVVLDKASGTYDIKLNLISGLWSTLTYCNGHVYAAGAPNNRVYNFQIIDWFKNPYVQSLEIDEILLALIFDTFDYVDNIIMFAIDDAVRINLMALGFIQCAGGHYIMKRADFDEYLTQKYFTNDTQSSDECNEC